MNVAADALIGAKMRKVNTRNREGENGFTLIELIVVVGIIGVLAAIAVPQYATYKSRAIDAQMQSALKNARTAMEAYYLRYQTYTGDEDALATAEFGYNDNDVVELDIFVNTATDYALRTCALGGSFTSWEFTTIGPNSGATVGSLNPCT